MAFNNAGIQVPPSDAADEPAEVFDRGQRDQPARGVGLHETRARSDAHPGQRREVNCSSLGGLVGLPGRAAYHASKHGVLGLTSSAALEYAPRGIRINAICPGTIATPMVTDMINKGELDTAEAIANQPINRLGEPEEIAAAVLWLCSPGASFVIGVALPLDGGYTARLPEDLRPDTLSQRGSSNATPIRDDRATHSDACPCANAAPIPAPESAIPVISAVKRERLALTRAAS